MRPLVGVLCAVIAGCSLAVPLSARPSLLLVTLDTTRADAVGPGGAADTPAITALAGRGRRFSQAYTTVPETLPAHVSMMSGLYPFDHGVHQNGRGPEASVPLVAEQLQQAGYLTAAVVSSFVLARPFGLARGFTSFNDDLDTVASERRSTATVDAAVALLATPAAQPLFLWVHLHDPHAPYEPPEPFRSQYPGRPYLGEVAAMDAQIGRLLSAFEASAQGERAIIIVGDHGEGLGDHGEAGHGALLYQSTMRVPLVIAGPGVEPGVSDLPVSSRHVAHTLLDWAGIPAVGSLRQPVSETVLGEAMKPYLDNGWQPQAMAVAGRHKAILSGRVEAYDVVGDPAEHVEVAAGDVPDDVRNAVRAYPLPERSRAPMPTDVARRLASLGYTSGSEQSRPRRDAPRAADMVSYVPLLQRASMAYAQGRHADAIPLLERMLTVDPGNLAVLSRLANAHRALGQHRDADRLSRRAHALVASR